MTKHEYIDLAVLLLICVLLSIYLFFNTHLISHDGAFQYIPMAKMFLSGSLKEAIGFGGQQPLYSILIAFVYHGVSDFELAGRLIASFFGIVLIFPAYFSGKRLFDRKVAFFSVLLFIIHPCVRRYSADVLKESSYLFFLAGAIWFSLRTIGGEGIYSYLFVPFFSVIAYLVRPDGIEPLLAVGSYLLFLKKSEKPGRKWPALSFLFVTSALLLFPYLLQLRGMTGEWTLSKAKSLGEILGWSAAETAIPLSVRIVDGVKKLNLDLLSTYHPFYLFLSLIGLFKKRCSHLKEGEKFLIILFSSHYLVLLFIAVNLTHWEGSQKSYFLSGRHILPLLLISIYWAGEGFVSIHHRLEKKLQRGAMIHADKAKRTRVAWACVLMMTILIIFPKTLKPQRYERLPEKWAGTWIGERTGKGTTILTTMPRVGFYAERSVIRIDFKKNGVQDVEASLIEKRDQCLVFQEQDLLLFPEMLSAIRKDYVEPVSFGRNGMEKVFVFLRARSCSPGSLNTVKGGTKY